MTIAKDKIPEIFCMADDFCHVYDRFIKINGLAPKRDKSKRRCIFTHSFCAKASRDALAKR